MPELTAALCRQPNVVLRAPTGAGKTTRVPPALLDAGLAGSKRIMMLEPRRLAARAAASRMAQERDSSVGEEIGYQVRFDRRFGPATRILVVTEGILIGMLHADSFLESTSIVIFDEFHERNLDSDLALGLLRLIQQTVRPDLRIVVMSATIEADAVSRYLGNCPVIASEGRLFPVDIQYEPRAEHLPLAKSICRAVNRLIDETPGDILVFLPGWQEIRNTSHQLQSLAQQCNLAVVPLHGDLPAQQQDAALLPTALRKIVLATNVAETSVTVPGITGVVDSGLARQLVFDPGVGMDRLKLTAISRASADQRAGRAGRTQPGVCIRLWSQANHLGRPDQTEPEIRRADLTGAALHLHCFGEHDIEQFPWLEPPRPATVVQAATLLQQLGAIDDRGVTSLGRKMARLPVHPRLGRLLVEGCRLNHLEQAALVAALLSERDPFLRSGDANWCRHPAAASFSDVMDRLEALEEFDRPAASIPVPDQLNRGAARTVLRSRNQLLRLCRQALQRSEKSADRPTNAMAPAEALARNLFAAFPDRLVRRRDQTSRRGVMVGGRGVRLAPTSAVSDAELLLGIDVDASEIESVVWLASGYKREWLPAERLNTTAKVWFDPKLEKVVASKQLCFQDLVIEENPAALPQNEIVARILADAAANRLDRVLPAPNSTAGEYWTRLRCLHAWMPELALPEMTEQDWRAALDWLCAGCRSFADLQTADWLGAIQSRLNHHQRHALDCEAPEKLQVPSGSRITLQYQAGRPPILAVRIQELFGLSQTPRLAAGRVPVLLHLLAPNNRPQQVTDDLASFWANTYPQVRKDLRARYPKHAWPEDPLAAMPQRRPQRK